LSNRKRKRILLDIRGAQKGFKEHSIRGIGRFVRGITERIPHLMNEIEFVYLIDSQYEYPNIRLPNDARIIIAERGLAFLQGKELLRTQIVLQKALKKTSPDLTIYFFHEDALLTDKKRIVFIHDMITFLFQKEYNASRGIRNRIKRLISKRLATQSMLIFTNSNSTKKDIVDVWDINPDKIKVVFAGIDFEIFKKRDPSECSNMRKKYALPNKYLLYVGGLDPRKNIETLLMAFNHVSKYNTNLYLVIVGDYTKSKYFKKFSMIIDRLKIRNRVIFPGFVPDEDLSCMYSESDALLFPSIYEGFGIPVIESLACGTPVITSRTSSIPEVAADLPIYTDTTDISLFAQSIINTLHNSIEIRHKIAQRNYIYKRFNWNAVTELVAFRA